MAKLPMFNERRLSQLWSEVALAWAATGMQTLTPLLLLVVPMCLQVLQVTEARGLGLRFVLAVPGPFLWPLWVPGTCWMPVWRAWCGYYLQAPSISILAVRNLFIQIIEISIIQK